MYDIHIIDITQKHPRHSHLHHPYAPIRLTHTRPRTHTHTHKHTLIVTLILILRSSLSALPITSRHASLIVHYCFCSRSLGFNNTAKAHSGCGSYPGGMKLFPFLPSAGESEYLTVNDNHSSGVGKSRYTIVMLNHKLCVCVCECECVCVCVCAGVGVGVGVLCPYSCRCHWCRCVSIDNICGVRYMNALIWSSSKPKKLLLTYTFTKLAIFSSFAILWGCIP